MSTTANVPLSDVLHAMTGAAGAQLAIEAGAVTAALLLPWLLWSLATRRRDPAARARINNWRGILVPLFALVAVLALRGAHWLAPPTAILNLAVPLLLSYAALRLIVHVLRHVFAPHPILKTSERFLATTIWVAFALHVLGVLPRVAAFLDQISVDIGAQHISLLTVLQAAAAVALTILLALWLARLFESRVIAQSGLDLSLRTVLSRVVRALLLFFAVLIVLPLVGIDITALSVFGGALGVGLGFGLQKIASNYVSGFIILLDRSIRLGDLVTVDNRYGVVSQIAARYTVVKSLDGTEAIIPNETLITNTVVNHSYTDKRALQRLGVQISYQSNLETALAILLQAAREQARALKEPAPEAYVKAFGESGIDLELAFWIADPEKGQAPLRSDVYRAIWREFQQAGIVIPYPQREVLMRTTTR